MFTKKSNIDLKKSTAKIQDSKKDSTARLRHLKTILGKFQLPVREHNTDGEGKVGQIYILLLAPTPALVPHLPRWW